MLLPAAMLTPMLLANDYPPDHPILQTAAKPEAVADRLVRAVDEEKFLILDSTLGTDAMTAKAVDFDTWITDVGARVSAPPDKTVDSVR